MNERVMQFRIGMFIIVAGLVLTTLLVWFGETPTLFRPDAFITIEFPEAPGIAVGIPIRKSGIRVGEVVLVQFDRRPNAGDGVLVTAALDPRYRIGAGARPRLSRALIGDVTIDLLPGGGPESGDLLVSKSPAESMAEGRILAGTIAPDPSMALELATRAFQDAGGTLTAIQAAAQDLSKLSAKAQNVDEFLDTWAKTGQRLGALSERLDAVVAANQGDVQPTLTAFRQAAARFNATFDEATQADLKASARNLAAGSARLDALLAELRPLAAELTGTQRGAPVSNLGQALQRLNKISYEVGLLSAALADPSGRKLNSEGSLQRLLQRPDLHDNLNRAALGLQETTAATRPVLRALAEFAERVARDPAVLSRGLLQSR